MYKILFLSIFLLASCSKNYGPTEALEAFIKLRFSSDDDRKKYSSFLVGDYKAEFDGMSEESFNQFIDMSKYKKKKFNMINKRCESDKCLLTYILTYEVIKDSKVSFVSDVKKMATVVKEVEKNTWKISDVVNLKTHYDSTEPINP